MYRNNGNHPCLTHTYDHGSLGNLKQKKNNIMVFDRMFLDFDVDNEKANKIKKQLIKLRRQY